MRIAQQWTMGMIGLGALYLVLANPNSFYAAALAFRSLVGNASRTVLRGGK